jgi:hypothetical protein
MTMLDDHPPSPCALRPTRSAEHLEGVIPVPCDQTCRAGSGAAPWPPCDRRQAIDTCRGLPDDAVRWLLVMFALSLLVVPLASAAQLPAPPRVAYLSISPGPVPRLRGFVHGLRGLGYVRARTLSWNTGGAQEASSGSARMRPSWSGSGWM